MTEVQSSDSTEHEREIEDGVKGEVEAEEPFTGPVVRSTKQRVPRSLHDERLWVMWDMCDKVALSPWLTGHCYPGPWGSEITDSDERPELTYAEVREYTDLGAEELNRPYSFPDGTPDEVRPTIIIPHEGLGNEYTETLTYVDLDDVRDPETGRVTPEAWRIIQTLDSYTEVSSSGTGVHIIVNGILPFDGWVNGDDLVEAGSIEIYDHSRLLGATWDHVDGTPTSINGAQRAINRLLASHSVHRLRKDWYEIKRERDGCSGIGTDGLRDRPTDQHLGSGRSKPRGKRSPYYDVPVSDFASPSITVKSNNGCEQGPHPVHGKTTGGAESDSTNYNLDTGLNAWHCFAHNSGGGAMEMAAIMAEVLDCGDAGEGSLDRLSDEQFLRTCLYARDTLPRFSGDMDPPYRALVAVAKLYDFPMSSERKEILGSTSHKLARVIYDELSIPELDSEQ